jgi:NO-binding membrane sensor protein with MHYT domain
VLHIHDFGYGPITPVLSYLVASLGVLLGLRAATRARACQGASRTRWLLLAGVSVGGIGIWGMNVVGLLGLAVAGETTRYNVVVMIASLLLGVAALIAGLLVTGFGGEAPGPLLAGNLLAGLGVTFSQYLGIAAIRMPVRVSYDPTVAMLSVAIAVAAGSGVLLGALHLRHVWATMGAAVLLGAAVSAAHYTVIAALNVSAAAAPAGMVLRGGGGATAASYALPVVLGVSVASFLVWAAVALAPTEDAIRYDAALLAHIRRRDRLAPHVGPALPRHDHQASAGMPPWALAQLRRPPEPR